jgi:protocatechuate 3,4-dioxygenase beta subunit
MFRFARFPIFLSTTLLVVFTVAAAQTQQQDGRPRTASVSGRVTIAGKPAVNAKVVITRVNDKPASGNQGFSFDPPGSGGGEDQIVLTDAEGRYRVANLPEGKYEAQVSLAGCVREKPSRNDSLMESFSLGEGASRENVDFALVRGGVITGRVTDADGRPLIERAISLQVVDDGGRKQDARNLQNVQSLMTTLEMFQTDDRGVYRVFGLRAGRYLVSAGGNSGMELAPGSGAEYARVWHPDAADENQAKVIEVAAGGEATGVDIRLGVAKKAYEASGRVVDDETGKPIAGASVICTKAGGSSSSVSFGLPGAMPRTDEQGNFHFGGLMPGQYLLSLTDFASFLTGGGSGYYSDGARFEIQSADVAGVEIRAKRGATISGVAVVEDADQSAKSGLAQTIIMAHSMPASLNEIDENALASLMAPSSSRIGSDGGFSLKGIRPGKVTIQAFSMTGAALGITRIERGGVEMRNEIMVTGRDEISGVRVVFGKGSCVIRGRVNVTGGAASEDWRMFVTANSEKEGGAALFDGSGGSADVDDKGRFVIEGLLPGEYQLTLMTTPRADPNSPPRPDDRIPAPVTQKVILTKGQEAQVTMTLDLSKKNREEK